jgi:hypothetical protein
MAEADLAVALKQGESGLQNEEAHAFFKGRSFALVRTS